MSTIEVPTAATPSSADLDEGEKAVFARMPWRILPPDHRLHREFPWTGRMSASRR